MRTLPAAVPPALAKSRLVSRDFIWLSGKNRTTGVVENVGFWSDFGTVTASVIDGLTGATVSRNFTGSGSLIQISEVPNVSNLTWREVTLTLSPLHDTVELAIRGYEPKGAPIQLYRGLFDPDTRAVVAAAVPRFVGFVNSLIIKTASENQESSIEMLCVSHTASLTRNNSDVRSGQSQKKRNAVDTFYDDTGVSRQWEIFWGREQGTLA